MMRKENRMTEAVKEVKHVVDEAVWLLQQDINAIERTGRPTRETKQLRSLLKDLSTIQVLVNSKYADMGRNQ